MNNEIYQEEQIQNIQAYLKDDCLVIVTATNLETTFTHEKMSPLPGVNKIIKFYKDSHTYYLGKFGSYKAIHIQSGMGSMSRDSSIMTVTEAINVIKPKLVIMPGIAFGVEEGAQKVGDVIVAETIYPYNNKRVGRNEEIQRGTPLNATKTVVNRFKSVKSNWEYLIDGKKKADLLFGAILSGEELIDNKVYRDKLVKKFPGVRGGEMEGGGLYAACDGRVEFILVKGICDFADGNKSKNKQKRQEIAIKAAISVCTEVFSSQTAFESIGLKSIETITTTGENTHIQTTINSNAILFDIYDKSKENYYLVRDIDNDLDKTLVQYGVWVYGISGCGKSNYVLRNLIQTEKEFIYISLASNINVPIDDFFVQILYDINDKIKANKVIAEPKSFPDCSKTILSILESKYKDKELVIFIEEIPINDENQASEFAEKIFSLIINKALMQGMDGIKFILSSINDPQLGLKSYNLKIKSHMKFVQMQNWNRNEISALSDLLESHLNLTLGTNIKELIETTSKGSPRFIKKFFRNAIINGRFDEVFLTSMNTITHSELSQEQ